MNSLLETPAGFRSGFVAVLGRPNVGKSTLINTLLEQKIAAVSPRPQTTRKRQLGILTTPEAQIIFVDTPGVHQPKHKLGEAMNHQAQEALIDSDLVLFMVDASQSPTSEDLMLAELILSIENPPSVLLLLNKADLLSTVQMEERRLQYQKILPSAMALVVSALHRANLDQLLVTIQQQLPEGPLYFSPNQVTDLFEREIAADLIREAALLHLRDEVPHGIAVRIDEYKDRDEHNAYIAATLLLERESHKSIVIGQKGTMLKQIGTSARLEIEKMTERRVFLELRVKVRKNWRNDESTIRLLGLSG
jgi:GTP-binding protein Era